ncbi:hypothetical protein, partial [uncultured Gimesia sp.]|uniref:hypothetical protein n=1 Tax=uncultured Gimesia sp. TaxID=1678688 RepID=UPI0026213DFE
KLSSFRFELTRRLFFPNNPVTLADLKLRVRHLNEQISQLVNHNKQITVVEIPPISYGFDPIHYRYSQRSALWKSLLAKWELPEIMNQSARNRGLDFIYSFYYLQPAIKRQWGKIYRKSQPARILADGTRISVY